MRGTALDLFVGLSGRFTGFLPGKGARLLDAALYPLIGNPLAVEFFQRRHLEKLSKIKKLENLLVISDIHIGDAVLFQTAVSALRDFFPKARIDYLVKNSMKSLLEGNPDVSDLWPAFTGGRFPDERDILTVQAVSWEYDAIFNFCPFFPSSTFPERAKVFHFTAHAPVFVKNERKPSMPNHIAYQAHAFIHDLFLSSSYTLQRTRPFEGPEVFLPPEAIKAADDFFKSKKVKKGEPFVFLNPDTASPYTRIPFGLQTKILQGLADSGCRIFLGDGHSEKGMGEKLLLSLPLLQRERVALVPSSLSLEAYTALSDWSDVFISGDTGPLHLAAAWKNPPKGYRPLRNRTAVISLFGATPPRLSGYDSRPGYLESAQDARSKSYQSLSSCRNLTCMHKMAKKCDAAGCFQGLDVDQILSDVRNQIRKPENLPPATKA